MLHYRPTHFLIINLAIIFVLTRAISTQSYLKQKYEHKPKTLSLVFDLS